MADGGNVMRLLSLFRHTLFLVVGLVFGLVPVAPAETANGRLAAEKSAFLRSYANTAVDWQPWSEATFARAKAEQKPIFLAIGSFTNELSRAMGQQSFANAEVAAFLREHFICVLVDAKERPDLTSLCQAYLRAAKQLSGLPINLWLTPELDPIDGSTYLPPTGEWGQEGFFATIKRIANAWKADPAAQRRQAHDALTNVRSTLAVTPVPPSPADIASIVSAATDRVRGQYDSVHGGFGDAPKYLEPELLQCLLRDPATRELALTTLRTLIVSPMRDPLDGGFFHCAQDPEWHQPSLQKHLADQARIALVLLDAAELTGYTDFADAAHGALSYALVRLQNPMHGFASAEDATIEQTGSVYFWTKAEIDDVLGDDSAAFCAAYGVTQQGNVPADAYRGINVTGRNLLFHALPAGAGDLAGKFAGARARLLAKRATRPAPPLDDYAPAAAHGLMLSALARGGDRLFDSHLKSAARAEFAFIRDHLLGPDGALRHLPDQPGAASPADYVFTIQGLWTAGHGGEAAAAPLAAALTKQLQAAYWDDTRGRYFATTRPSGPPLWFRPYVPPPTAGDLPLADAAMLAGSALHALPTPLIPKLQLALAAQLRDAGDDRRGDLMLALQTASH